jgi:hypothetical protein
MTTPGILFNGEPVDVRTLYNEDNSATVPEPEIDEEGEWDDYLDHDDTVDYDDDDEEVEDNDGNDYRSPQNSW